MLDEKLREYRTQLYRDLYSNIIPDRVPVQDGLCIEAVIQYAGMDLLQVQYSYDEKTLDEAFGKVYKDILRGDAYRAMYARNAIAMMLEGSRLNQMGSNGMIQHPELEYMRADEYDEYIENPFDFYIEKISPRMSAQYEKGPAFRSRAYMLKYLSNRDQNAVFGKVSAKYADEYSLFKEPVGSSGMTQPPFDLIADMCRGFSQIPMDLRRCPEKLWAAMDATMPYLITTSKTPRPDVLGSTKIMTHMAAFLSTKQFEKFYFPHFNELTHINAERDVYMTMFLEQDWTRFVDYLVDMPMGTRFYMECGDMQKFKDAMGKKFVLGGFYPLDILRSSTKEQCIDKAKEIIDIMAPGGNYFFNWGKSALCANDIDVDNYVAVMEWVKDNTKYANAGAKVSDIDRDSTIIKGLANKYPEFKSKYVLTWDEFKKEYPPVDERVEPLMKKAYEKYLGMIAFDKNC